MVDLERRFSEHPGQWESATRFLKTRGVINPDMPIKQLERVGWDLTRIYDETGFFGYRLQSGQETELEVRFILDKHRRHRRVMAHLLKTQNGQIVRDELDNPTNIEISCNEVYVMRNKGGSSDPHTEFLSFPLSTPGLEAPQPAE